VTVDTLAAAARRQIDPAAFVAVVVADAALVLGPLRSLDWGEVEVEAD
jgi:hypothetical protein